MNSITKADIFIIRSIRWILFIPTMFCAAFCSGIAFIPAGFFGSEIAILISALAGIVMAPRHRVLATFLAFLYGNYLYAKNVDTLYAETFMEFLEIYVRMVQKYFSMFAGPTVLTLILAVILDLRTKKIEAEYLQPTVHSEPGTGNHD